MKKTNMCVTREAAMLELQQLGFVLVDLNLYLDNNPNDQEAINDYNCAFQAYWEKKNAYETQFGPLANFGYCPASYPWSWVNEPWPWEM